jgi:hypothetical protein
LKDQYEDSDLFDKSYIVRWIWLSAVIAGVFTTVIIQAPVHMATGPLAVVNMATIQNMLELYLPASVVLACVIVFMKKGGLYKRCIAFFNGLMIMAFILNAIPSNAAIMNGSAIVNDWSYAIVRLSIAFVISECLAFALWRPLKYFPMLLAVMSIVFSAIDYATIQKYEKASNDRNEEQIVAEAATFSTDKNVIVIAIDTLSGSASEEQFILHPEFKESFDGFTFFSRSFTSFNFTFFSRGTILSGNLYSSESNDPHEEETASIKDSFLSDLGDGGYDVTTLGYDTQGVTKSVETFDWLRGGNVNMGEYGDLFVAGVARLTGIWMYNPWGLVQSFDSSQVNLKLDTLSMCEALKDNVSVSEEKRALFMWWMIVHLPVRLEKSGNLMPENVVEEREEHVDEITLSFNKLEEFFQLLKDNNVYDNSLIIVLSDHGGIFDSKVDHLGQFEDLAGFENNYSNYKPVSFYNTTLLVKPPYARGNLEITKDPAWLGDIRSIIDYYTDNFENVDPKLVEANIRKENPDVSVMYSDVTGYSTVLELKSAHKFIVVKDIYQISDELFKKTGIVDDPSRFS